MTDFVFTSTKDSHVSWWEVLFQLERLEEVLSKYRLIYWSPPGMMIESRNLRKFTNKIYRDDVFIGKVTTGSGLCDLKCGMIMSTNVVRKMVAIKKHCNSHEEEKSFIKCFTASLSHN